MECKRKNPCDVSEEFSVKLRCKKSSFLNDGLKECIGNINRSWAGGDVLETDNVRVNPFPFKHCVVKNFIQDEQYLKKLKEELVDLPFLTKRNDLYQFHQTVDLMTRDKPYINRLKIFLKEECRDWLESTTGICLECKVSSTCSSYTFSDHLLCHDDKCEDRRIAFILYLNENWLSEFGGALEIFSADDYGQPDKVVSTIEPVFNTFVFFEVTHNSFHQVSEVKTMDRARLSVNGWFHGPLPPPAKARTGITLVKQLFPPQHVTNGVLSYVNPMYLNPEVQEQINDSFERESEILLPDFFENNFYSDLCKCMTSNQLSWKIEGPANRRKYEVLQEENLPQPLKHVLELFKSEQFFRLLSNLTKLDLFPDGKGTATSMPLCSYQVERWKSGFYTLLYDFGNKRTYALDVVLYCNVQQTKQLQGGFMSYVADNADEELLTLVPSHNALALTFRDSETNRFVKYINNLFDSCFQVVSFTYYEANTRV